jgi:4-aminobutyrate aminotransferase/(S)-3-amino-2-methylpropionate transaminase
VIDDEGLVERSAALGAAMRARMEGWQARWLQVGDVRGLGSMLVIELVGPDSVPDGELASRVVEEALARGLLLIKAGVANNCIRVLVPLVISDSELDEALGVWEDALEAAL